MMASVDRGEDVRSMTGSVDGGGGKLMIGSVDGGVGDHSTTESDLDGVV